MRAIAKWIPGLLVGTLATAIASFVHADRIRIDGQAIHHGLLLAPALLLSTQRWLMNSYRSRSTGIAFFIAWLVVSVRLAIPNSDGDLAFGDIWYSSVYLGTTALVLSTSAFLSPRRKPLVVSES